MKPAVRKMLDDAPSGVARRSFFKTLGLGTAGKAGSADLAAHRGELRRHPRGCAGPPRLALGPVGDRGGRARLGREQPRAEDLEALGGRVKVGSRSPDEGSRVTGEGADQLTVDGGGQLGQADRGGLRSAQAGAVVQQLRLGHQEVA